MDQVEIKYFASEGHDEVWQQCYALTVAIASRRGEKPDSLTWQDMRAKQAKADAGRDPHEHALIIENGTPKLYMYTTRVSPGSENLSRWLVFDLLEEEPSDALRDAFARELATRLDPSRTSAIRTRVDETRQANFLKVVGARVYNRYLYFKLPRQKLSASWLTEQAERIASAQPEIRLEYCQYIPEEWLEEFARVYTIFLSKMEGLDDAAVDIVTPDGLRNREAKPGEVLTQYHVIAFHGEKLIGHSNIWMDTRQHETLHQFMTGVLPEYQGREIGFWMKCAMYRWLLEAVPDFGIIHTDTIAANKRMQRLNERLGFEQTNSGYGFEITRNDISIT